MINKIKAIMLVAIVTGCSSPPPPVPVDWDKAAEPLNTRLPQWSDNNVIVPSQTVNGKCISSISAQSFHDTIWSPAVFYAVAHSTRIVVTAQSGTDFFNAKNWLRHNGAKGVIEYQPVFNCLPYRETTIYFSRQSI
ncbi:Cag pathogenicity island protein Cag12 [Salmonella enterica subsp. diarizonae]|uniref:Cag pathogenicity island protein Cag12 n=1 Tax=Salmonella diarizonae TaxID=59204 RepID=A0A3T3L547_SALDZ|nr:cag pathogenicity island Cag12 family protein [Salmonella enterica]ECU8749660.1 Cag pathogenicity island protein Cag12 [Salmonella enterica subsp. diarizonae str. CFSAN000558]EHQ9196936.1 Cag pathogenicity island protein Cag12 [Salmonella enterica subsp. diarizonae serovar 50:k:z:[z50],[z57],[z68], [z86]]HAE8383820.1 Cag pathogenicity island protein Cag12 [Salmonella enterica subsp. diarizonae serovar 50:k:z]ASG76450.1 Cag pathogenicity island protein Cag12 [Salmonella enterica subsp. diariz